MGNKSVKKKNELYDTQRQTAQNLQTQMAGYGAEDRTYSTESRGDINSKYNSLYDEVGSDGWGDGGGGGGEVYTPQYEDARQNEYAGDYRNWATHGASSAQGAQDLRARSNSTLPAFYDTMRNQQFAANNAAGGNVGFNSQMAKMAREQAYGANRVAADTEGALEENKKWGITGGSGLDEGLIQRQMQVERERQAAAASGASQRNAAANARYGNRQEGFRNRMSILDAQRGLRGEAGSDLPYWQAAGGFGNQATQNIAGREIEKSGWDKAGAIAKGVGRGVAAFYTGGLSEAALAGYGALKKKGAGSGADAGPGPDGEWS